jgi:hypothetical protein
MEEAAQDQVESPPEAMQEGRGSVPPPVEHGLQDSPAAPPSKAPPAAEGTEALVTDKVPVDQLAQLDYDKSVFFFGIVPILAVCAILLVYVALYFYRRGKQWNEIGEAMRFEEEPGTASRQSGFSTAELANLDPTKPSERLRKIDDTQG